jgi:hypothetical protein
LNNGINSMISRLIDRACHPAVAYPNLGYIQQAMRFFMTAFKGKQASKNIVYGIWLMFNWFSIYFSRSITGGLNCIFGFDSTRCHPEWQV